MASLSAGGVWGYFSALVVTEDGHLMATGIRWPGGGGDELVVVKADREGRVVSAEVPGAAHESSSAMVAAPGGGVVVAGAKSPPASTESDGLLLGLASDGALLWKRTYDAGGRDSFVAMGAAPGGYVLGGAARQTGLTSKGWIVRVDAGGSTLWTAELDGQGNEAVSAVAATPGGFLAAGTSAGPGGGEGDAWLAWLDASGGVVARRKYVEGETIVATDMLLLEGGEAALLVELREPSREVVVRVGAQGDEVWRAEFPAGDEPAGPSRLVLEPGGGLTVVSTVNAALPAYPPQVTRFFRLGTAGALEDQRDALPPPGIGYTMSSASALPGGGYALAGGGFVAHSPTAGRPALLRLDPFGESGCSPVLGCLGADFAGCDDGDPCTVEACDAAVGCLHELALDGLACGPSMQCKAGACVAAPP
jgi:hypothetical protein